MPEFSLPLMRRQGALAPQSYNEQDNSVDAVWTTGAVVRRANFSLFEGVQEFDEELIVTPGAVRLDRLNAGAPLLDSHWNLSIQSVLGAVVPGTARIAQGQGLATVRLSRAPEHAGMVRNIADGIVRNVSVGYRIHAVNRIENDGKIPLVRVTDWEPMEISAVPIGADAGAAMRSDGGLFPVLLLRADVNGPGRAYAESMIAAGNYDATAAWDFTADDENALLGAGGDDWTGYGRHFLGQDPASPRTTKAHWKYPFAKLRAGQSIVFRSALIAIRQRSGQQKDTEIFDSAGALIEAIDGKEGRGYPAAALALRMRMRQAALRRLQLR